MTQLILRMGNSKLWTALTNEVRLDICLEVDTRLEYCTVEFYPEGSAYEVKDWVVPFALDRLEKVLRDEA